MPNDPKCPIQFKSVHNMIKICKTSACAGIRTLQFWKNNKCADQTARMKSLILYVCYKECFRMTCLISKYIKSSKII